MDMIDQISKTDFSLLLTVGLAAWMLISGIALWFCLHFFTTHWKKENTWKQEIRDNSDKIRAEMHAMNNFLTKYGGTVDRLAINDHKQDDRIDKQGHQITTIRTIMHMKGLSKYEPMDWEGES